MTVDDPPVIISHIHLGPGVHSNHTADASRQPRPCLDKAPPSLGTHTLGLASNLTIAMSFQCTLTRFRNFHSLPSVTLAKTTLLVCRPVWPGLRGTLIA